MFIKYPFCVPYCCGAEAPTVGSPECVSLLCPSDFQCMLARAETLRLCIRGWGQGRKNQGGRHSGQGLDFLPQVSLCSSACIWLAGGKEDDLWNEFCFQTWLVTPYTNHSLAQHTCQILCKWESREEGTRDPCWLVRIFPKPLQTNYTSGQNANHSEKPVSLFSQLGMVAYTELSEFRRWRQKELRVLGQPELHSKTLSQKTKSRGCCLGDGMILTWIRLGVHPQDSDKAVSQPVNYF